MLCVWWRVYINKLVGRGEEGGGGGGGDDRVLVEVRMICCG